LTDGIYGTIIALFGSLVAVVAKNTIPSFKTKRRKAHRRPEGEVHDSKIALNWCL